MLTEKQTLFADGLQEELVEIRRHLHQNPEIGLELPKTVAFVKEKLTEYGYDPQSCGESGITVVAGKKPGKTFLLRGDMDALPIKELTDLSFKSENGYMHACGHDMHTTMLLGAAKILKEFEDELEGQVKLLFQPGEEILSGSKVCIESGVLENPKVDAGMMMHVFPFSTLKVGQIMPTPGGTFMASADWFEINIKGRGGHGSQPETSIDPINVAVHIYTALQELSAREIGSEERFVLTIGEFTGGTPGASNIIPETTVMKGTLRTLKEDVRVQVKERMIAIAENIAKAFRAEAEVVFTNGCTTNINDPELSAFTKDSLTETFGAERIVDIPISTPLMGSEDFGEISQLIPTATVLLVASEENINLHNPAIVFDESILKEGAKVYFDTAVSWLKK
ncbi:MULTISPECIES: M20 metallopeptidase family protein [unclassified Enterococcus]|uniref:M20 metallopeptidase family protein n=1 Tax=unclassified Enterococcus TaxID=2608891 RepID=UPI001CE19D00|nr:MULTISPECIES: M20 family metallopeptidase [unclassified Enterococcus]MCA5012385.1 amidohydrolase [Enterococcus sp. S23]MCA5015636.1 amidohydrolase [Enterococcus sp. S22(2020)]